MCVCFFFFCLSVTAILIFEVVLLVIAGSGDLSRNSGAEVEQVNNQAAGERRLQQSTT